MASIHQHGPGFRVQYMREGKLHRSPSVQTREAAAAWMADNLPAAAALDFFGLLGVWQAEAPTPYRSEVVTRLSAAARARGWSDIRRIDLGELRAWQRECECPRYGQYMATVLRWAASEHHLDVRADAIAWKPRAYARRAPSPLLTDQQVASITEAAAHYGARASAIIDYLLTYGARPITACQLRLRNLDLRRGELEIDDAKHSGGWRHALHDRHLEAWPTLTIPMPEGKAGDAPLFPHYLEDRPWKVGRSASELGDWYRNTIAKRLKLGPMGGIYHLKRYAITGMLRRGIDPATVALFTGHLDLDQVLKYARSNSRLQRGALAAMDAAPMIAGVESHYPKADPIIPSATP